MKHICIVGLGIGQLYVDAAKQLNWHVTTVDIDPTLNADYTDIRTIPRRTYFEMAIICTPNDTHESIARYLTKHTDRIVIEKPGFESTAKWLAFQYDYSKVKLFMVKNNMYRTNELEFIRNSIIDHGVHSIKLLGINKHRIPGAGSWFTDKRRSYGGVSRDLMPHLLSVVQAILRESDISSDNFIARRHQNYTMADDVHDSNYGKSNKSGIYDVDDQAYFHTYVNGVSIECAATWKFDTDVDKIEWHITLKNGFVLKYVAGLCPIDAYANMLDAYMLMTDKKYRDYKYYDIQLHHIMDNFTDADCNQLIKTLIHEN